MLTFSPIKTEVFNFNQYGKCWEWWGLVFLKILYVYYFGHFTNEISISIDNGNSSECQFFCILEEQVAHRFF